MVKRIVNAVGTRLRHAINNSGLAFHIVNGRLRTIFSARKPRVTIFGSCRQDSIYEYFDVTNIRNGLTYPHYSKEVIQAIKYCKNLDFDVPSTAFRNFQISTKLASRKSLKRAFEETDIFVVEIASMLEYKYRDNYLHHEIYDNPVIHHKFPELNLNEIERTEQEVSDLQSDLETIVELLRDKEIIFACHFNTREKGRRADLESQIIKFCEQRGISIFVPKDLLEFYSERELFVEEEVLSHFSEFGHRIAGYRYRELIETLMVKNSSKNRPLVQKLEKPPLGLDGFTSGFGDFLNGALKVYEIARRLNRTPQVDLSNSLIAGHVNNRFKSVGLGEARKIFHQDHDLTFAKSTIVFTNKVPAKELSEESRDFIFRNCLSQKDGQRQELNRIFKDLELKRLAYEVVHVRVDDKFDANPNESTFSNIKSIIEQLNFDDSRKMILLSNSNIVRTYFANLGIESPLAHVKHSADPEATDSSISNMLIEFHILGNSSHIFQLSTYEWGSGFSSLAAKLFNVPLTRVKLPTR